MPKLKFVLDFTKQLTGTIRIHDRCAALPFTSYFKVYFVIGGKVSLLQPVVNEKQASKNPTNKIIKNFFVFILM